MTSVATAMKWWGNTVQVGNVIVYHLDLSPNSAREAEAFGWLDDHEVARSRRFTSIGPRRRYILCRAALRSIVCNILGCPNKQLTIGSSYYEKPYAIVEGKSHPICFNVSHSGNHGLIGLGKGGRVGVDIEEWDPDRNLGPLMETAFTPAERTAMESTDAINRQYLFFRLWTIKEALIKAVGMGLSLDMSSFEVPSPLQCGATSTEFHFLQAPSVSWRLDTLIDNNFCAAIAQELGVALSSKQPDRYRQSPAISVS